MLQLNMTIRFSCTKSLLKHATFLWEYSCRKSSLKHATFLWVYSCTKSLLKHATFLWEYSCTKSLLKHATFLWEYSCTKSSLKHATFLWEYSCTKFFLFYWNLFHDQSLRKRVSGLTWNRLTKLSNMYHNKHNRCILSLNSLKIFLKEQWMTHGNNLFIIMHWLFFLFTNVTIAVYRWLL